MTPRRKSHFVGVGFLFFFVVGILVIVFYDPSSQKFLVQEINVPFSTMNLTREAPQGWVVLSDAGVYSSMINCSIYCEESGFGTLWDGGNFTWYNGHPVSEGQSSSSFYWNDPGQEQLCYIFPPKSTNSLSVIVRGTHAVVNFIFAMKGTTKSFPLDNYPKDAWLEITGTVPESEAITIELVLLWQSGAEIFLKTIVLK